MRRNEIIQKAIRIDHVLTGAYGAKPRERHTDPTEELVVTILSQNTNDTNRDRAFRSLKAAFPQWSDVATARASAVAQAIKVGGLARIKSGRVIKILRQIGECEPDYNLSFLKNMSDKDAWEFLTSFEGVGPKTASCVMLFSLGRKAMPVDTHVHRVGTRLGLIPKGCSAEKAHRWFFDLDLPVNILQLHLNMIQHGRTLCRPKNPKCEPCPLRRLCLYYRKLL